MTYMMMMTNTRVFFFTYLYIAGFSYNMGKPEGKRLLCKHRHR